MGDEQGRESGGWRVRNVRRTERKWESWKMIKIDGEQGKMSKIEGE